MSPHMQAAARTPSAHAKPPATGSCLGPAGPQDPVAGGWLEPQGSGVVRVQARMPVAHSGSRGRGLTAGPGEGDRASSIAQHLC